MDEESLGLAIITVVLIVAIFSIGFMCGKQEGTSIGIDKVQQSAIENKVAYWHPVTKEFCWNTNKLEAVELKK